jgi:uracil-DNA glycosylase
MIDIGNDWTELLAEEFEKDYYKEMRKRLAYEYKTQTVYPHMNDIFNALRYVARKDVKAVILGQDPYHGPGQAHGLSFSVKKGVTKPPSLVNIFKELQTDLGITPPGHGELTAWAREGVLLLNAVLTVRAGDANSHANIGWQLFTDNIFRLLNDRNGTIVFMMWGKNAKAKEPLITNKNHRILTAAHPSPFSADNGFFGCRHFSRCNMLLEISGVEPINWKIED